MEVRCERFLACLGANEGAYQNANPNIHGSRVLLRLNEQRATLQMAGRSMNTTELLGPAKHANQHRLSRLAMESHSDELRNMALAVEVYNDALIEALESVQRQNAQDVQIKARLR